MDKHHESISEFLKNLSAHDFMNFGKQHIAYLKPVMLDNDEKGYAVHAADGTPIVIAEDFDIALTEAHKHHLSAVTLH